MISNGNGEFNGSFVIPEGSEGVKFFIDVADASNTSAQFLVEDYKKKDFYVELEANDIAQTGEEVQIKLNSRYFSGAALSNAEVNWKITLRDTFTSIPEYSDYSFTNKLADDLSDMYMYCYLYCENVSDFESEIVLEGEARTDENGEAIIRFNSTIDPKYVLQLNTFYAEITDINNEVVITSKDIKVINSDIQLGYRFSSYFNTVGEELNIDYVSLDTNSNPVDSNFTVAFYKRNEDWVRTEDSSLGLYYEYIFDDIYLYEEGLRTSNGKASVNFIPSSGGLYVAKVF
ncbi:MAG: hypothetical protein Q9M91_04425 [Candidatus Dojkabacteria bacterium]|nr:hypothetical protein [Candidatus Dojkabacteria bacterium]